MEFLNILVVQMVVVYKNAVKTVDREDYLSIKKDLDPTSCDIYRVSLFDSC